MLILKTKIIIIIIKYKKLNYILYIKDKFLINKMINIDSIEHEIINDLSDNLITNYLIMKEFNYLPAEVNLHIIKSMFENSEEIITLEKDKSLIISIEILVMKILSLAFNEKIDLLDYGLCPIIDNKMNLLLKNIFEETIGKMFNFEIPINYEILKNESLDDITEINKLDSFREVKFFYDININENLKIMIIKKFNDFKINPENYWVFETMTKILGKLLVKSMETNTKYLTEYDWCFIEEEKIPFDTENFPSAELIR